MTISVNMLIRDEPFAFYGLASVAPYVDEIILVDTGSDKKYLDSLEVACKEWPHIKFFSKPIPKSAHGWQVRDGQVVNADKSAGEFLGDMRRWMHEESKGDVIWILDGDEIYNDEFAQWIGAFASNNKVGFLSSFYSSIYAAHVPVYDFLDKTAIRLKHNMGRLFKKDKTEIKSHYPFEMHHVKGGSCITNNHPNNFNTPEHHGFVYHMEAIVKPHRKEITRTPLEYHGTFPEVLERYNEYKVCKDLIVPYGF
jgi:hypothetical protein